MGERDGFTSPLTSISDSFGVRPNVGAGEITTTGQLDVGAWFKGDIALFGGVAWKATDKLTLLAEYSSDEYSRETARGLIDQQSPFNLGLNYAFDNGLELGAYYMYGTDAGISLSYSVDPKISSKPSGRGNAPTAISARSSVAAQS